MFGRYTLGDGTLQWLSVHYAIQLPLDAISDPRYNVAPSQAILVVVEQPEGRRMQWMQWGFTPEWLGSDAKHPPPINARAETLLERRMFRAAFPRAGLVSARMAP